MKKKKKIEELSAKHDAWLASLPQSAATQQARKVIKDRVDRLIKTECDGLGFHLG